MAEWKSWGDEQVATEEKMMSNQAQMLKLAARPQPYTLRFLPATGEETSPFRLVFQHYWDKPDGSRSVVSCPMQVNKTYCGVCDRLKGLAMTGNPVDEKLAKKAQPKTRVYANVIDMENQEAGPQVFAFGKTIYDALVALRRNPHWGDFTDPENGYDIQITVKGSGIDTEYTVNPIPQRTMIADFSWLDIKNDLNRFGTLLPPEEMERALMSLPSTSQHRNNTASAPAARQMGSGPGPRAALPASPAPTQRAAQPASQPRPINAPQPAPARAGRTIDAAPRVQPGNPAEGQGDGDDDDIPF